jgi:UDP-GlcNAc:undecaprenyl-phosphate/decaprenyl-phosphate GlcNAc-1-phosphate transferase
MNPAIPVVVAVLLGLCLGYPAWAIARSFNLIDVPGSASHKTHRFPTPLAGGFLIVLSLLVSAVIFHGWLDRNISVTLVASFVIFLFGVWDDKKGLSAAPKLWGQCIAGLILVSQGIQVHFVDVFYDAGYISFFIAQVANILVTFFWLIGITNAVNMIDSMDGIVAGIGMIASLCYLYATNVANQQALSVWSAVLFGICVGLYFWNKLLGKIFLGDSGAQTIGFLLATLGILYNPRGLHPESSWFFPIMLLGVPIFDTTLVVLSRFKKDQPIGTGRRDHTYHRLIAMGLSPKIAVFITHLVALLVSGLAFFTFFLTPLTAVLVFLATFLAGIAVLIWFERKPTLDSEQTKRSYESE